jgi:3-oxoacyl-[acyl-carrier protein] reductase
MGKLAGKVAVVTGASKGIGAGIAKGLAAEGALVAVNYLSSKADGDRVVAEITSSGGKAIAIHGDLSKAADVQRIFAETLAAFGRLDVLVNNAAIFEYAPLEGITEDTFHRQFNTNVLSVVLATQEAVKHFGENGGSVINIGSLATQLFPKNATIYAGTKAAVDAMTIILSKELGPKKIRVNSINPGLTVTEGTTARGLGDAVRDPYIAITPLGRVGMPEDFGPIAAFLASDESHWITGQILLASGGLR